MYTKLNASRSYVYAVGRACDQGHVSRRVSKIGALRSSSTYPHAFAGLCWSDPVFHGAGYRGCAGGYAMPGRERLYQRLSNGPNIAGFEALCGRCGDTGNQEDVDREGIQ